MSRGIKISILASVFVAVCAFLLHSAQYEGYSDPPIFHAMVAGVATFIFCLVCWLLIKLVKSGFKKLS
jgi:uncharacterized membrane protein YhdT